MSNKRIKRVGVIGAGVMGSGIAAHLASAGIDVLLVDIVPRDAPAAVDANDPSYDHVRHVRNGVAAGGLIAASKLKPAAFQRRSDAARIDIGNLDDDMVGLGACDWVVEAVIERLDIKQSVFARLDEVRGEHTIISSNTSGIPLAKMVEGRSEGFVQHFLVTHFFNPVRYMKLLEIIPGPDTAPAVTARMADFCRDDLGKGVVYAKDTVNFIANRIGVHGMMAALQAWLSDGYRIDEIDTIFGEPMGRPRSAIFRTADVVGLDTFGHVARNCYDNLPDDEERDIFLLPAVVEKLIAEGRTGQKAKAGFYKKVGRQIMVVDPETMAYVPQDKPRFPSVGAARKLDDPGARIKTIALADDRAGTFAWKVLSASLVYAANRLGEIADDVVSIDRAMCWGFNWSIGPFQIWDAIGVQIVADKLKAEGRAVPAVVANMLAAGQTSFYGDGVAYTASGALAVVPELPGIHLDAVRKARDAVASNESAELLDLGDGVLGLAFRSKMNALDDKIIGLGQQALEWLDAGRWQAMVVANDGANFSVGANLMFIAGFAQAGKWRELEAAVKAFQDFNQRMKFSRSPIVSAPHQMALGGGCEVAMHTSRMQAAAETYMGLVEVGVGLLPAAGGTKEMVVRALAGVPANVKMDRFPLLQRTFEFIGMAKVATGAGQMQEMGFMRSVDGWSIDGDRRIADAKRVALSLVAAGYKPALPADNLVLPGADGVATVDMGLNAFKWGGYASEHDCVVGHQIARVICGGDSPGTKTEQQLLDLEREAFLSLAGEPKTQERVAHMLKTGKPLRN